MSTAGALINRVSRQLLSGTVEERNKLATTVNSAATSIVMTYALNSIRAGAVFEIDSELMYVWSVDTATLTATVERAYAGTTAAAHTSGAIVVYNPRFPQQQLLDVLNQDIDDLSSPLNALYRVITVDLSYNGSDRQINIPSASSIIDLIDVRLRYLSDDFVALRGTRLARDLPTADFASTFAITLDQRTMAGTLRVRYRAPFVRATTTADNLQTVSFLPVSMEDILEYGIMARMLAPREVKRNFTESQGDTRRADEVPVGAVSGSASSVLRLRRDRIIAEAAKLARQYPLTIRV